MARSQAELDALNYMVNFPDFNADRSDSDLLIEAAYWTIDARFGQGATFSSTDMLAAMKTLRTEQRELAQAS